MRCHVPPCVPATLSTASCTRFSPSTVSPASMAAWTTSAGCVFDTATSVTAAGSRPARSAASPIRASTASRRSRERADAVVSHARHVNGPAARKRRPDRSWQGAGEHASERTGGA